MNVLQDLSGCEMLMSACFYELWKYMVMFSVTVDGVLDFQLDLLHLILKYNATESLRTPLSLTNHN
jgi:hypothetical protein